MSGVLCAICVFICFGIWLIEGILYSCCSFFVESIVYSVGGTAAAQKRYQTACCKKNKKYAGCNLNSVLFLHSVGIIYSKVNVNDFLFKRS